jgi:hypothetical protein
MEATRQRCMNLRSAVFKFCCCRPFQGSTTARGRHLLKRALQTLSSLDNLYVLFVKLTKSGERILISLHRDIQYVFQVECLVLEQQLNAALLRTSALRARAVSQNDFLGEKQALKLEHILLHSQCRLNSLS